MGRYAFSEFKDEKLGELMFLQKSFECDGKFV
jgi:hypothetical protein